MGHYSWSRLGSTTGRGGGNEKDEYAYSVKLIQKSTYVQVGFKSDYYTVNWDSYIQNVQLNSSKRYKLDFRVDSGSTKTCTFPAGEYQVSISTTLIKEGSKIYMTLYEEVYVATPPSTPSSITIPSLIKEGDKFTVSWDTGSGATKYYLQRSINGGSYTNIYNGTTRNYSDTALASWNTVSYRVRGYNSDGYSSYRTSSSITVTHFPEFNMRVNGALKASDNGWVKVNGVLKEIDSIWVRVSGTLKEV